MLDVKLKGPPNEDIIYGYPNSRDTWPHIRAHIELRMPPKLAEKNENGLDVTKVAVGLYRTDVAFPPSKQPGGSRKEQSFLVTRVKDVYNVSGKSPVFGLDIPFTLSLPVNKDKPMPASMYLPKVAESAYYLFVTISGNNSPDQNVKFPLRIRRFDTLHTFPRYARPLVTDLKSSDHLVIAKITLPKSAFGHTDNFEVAVEVKGNQDWIKSAKVKLRKVSVSLFRRIKYTIPNSEDSAAMPERQVRLFKRSKEMGDFKLKTAPPEIRFSLCVKEDEEERSAEKDYTKEVPEYSPEACGLGFTNASSLYQVEFSLLCKVKVSGAKNIETEIPILISPFSNQQSLSYERAIIEAEQAVQTLPDVGDPRPRGPFDRQISLI